MWFLFQHDGKYIFYVLVRETIFFRLNFDSLFVIPDHFALSSPKFQFPATVDYFTIYFCFGSLPLILAPSFFHGSPERSPSIPHRAVWINLEYQQQEPDVQLILWPASDAGVWPVVRWCRPQQEPAVAFTGGTSHAKLMLLFGYVRWHSKYDAIGLLCGGKVSTESREDVVRKQLLACCRLLGSSCRNNLGTPCSFYRHKMSRQWANSVFFLSHRPVSHTRCSHASSHT